MLSASWVLRSVLSAIVLAGCAADEGPAICIVKDRRVGAWVNRFASDPELAGLVVQQFPDCPALETDYEGRHPAMVLYVFADGRVCQNTFAPDGGVEEDFWWRANTTDPIWQRMTPAR